MSHPALPTSAYLRQGNLHYLTTIQECQVWWDDEDPENPYLVTTPSNPNGLWVCNVPADSFPPEVREFIHNHASL